jgi:glycosyltransferase involved in cell wall biosynthesis
MYLSIVVPVYNSAACLPELARRVQRDVGGDFEKYELLLVNDDSPDKSWDVIVRLTEEYDFITGVNLRKNVGQDNAIMAGLHYASGEVVVIMDDDLQHDPSDIRSLYREAQNGSDVVYAYFCKKEQAFWKNLGSRFNDWAARLVLGKPKHIYMSPYKAIRREVVDELIKYDGPYSYIDGLIFTITSNLVQIPVTHHARFAGTGNYTLLKSIGVWLKLATGFSVIPLRLTMIVGGLISLFSFMMACYFLLKTLLWEQMPEGWPSLIVAVFFLGGIQLMAIGAVGEYIARIFMTQNKRPQFTIKAVYRSTRTPKVQDSRGSVLLGLR